MRTSRISRETTKVMKTCSPTRRSARTSQSLRNFKLPGVTHTPNVSTKIVPILSDDDSPLSSPDTDIEDLLEPPAKRRKDDLKNHINSKTNPRLVSTMKEESHQNKTSSSKIRRQPARKIKGADGFVKVQPPSNWETVYKLVKEMRESNPTAPVDTMGCAELHWRASSPRDRRFQTLIALMLSSQTKDTVTAEAMQRLHTQLGTCTTDLATSTEAKAEPEEEKGQDSTLNLENMLAFPPMHLNELIRTVGFHNNKTKYIKDAAIILRDKYESDIPSTAEELMKLPGVGPKMAYLCMSAAWGKHEGIGVDVHVHRITNLWGWHNTKTPEETRKALQSWLPKDKWHEINKLLVGLGQTVCVPVRRRCGECVLANTGLCKGEVGGKRQEKAPLRSDIAEDNTCPSQTKVKAEAL